jgi:hypothetical protein
MRILGSAAVAAVVMMSALSGASAYEEFRNASVVLANGQTSGLDKLAAAYCVKKGFKGAEAFDFAGFQPNGSGVNAVFSSVKCTFVAGILPNSDGTRSYAPVAGGSGVNYQLISSQSGQSIATSISNAAAIGSAISKHGVQ